MPTKNNSEIKIFCSKDWVDYELLDTGRGKKLALLVKLEKKAGFAPRVRNIL